MANLMDYDEEDPQAAYLQIAQLFLPALLSQLRDGTLTPPIEIVLSDSAGRIGTWQVDGFGKFTDPADTDRELRQVEFPVDVLCTDRNGQGWRKHIEKDEVD